MSWLVIAAGGAIGASLRHGLYELQMQYWPQGNLVWATAFVNVCGCFLIGALCGWLGVRASGDLLRGFLVFGILGAFTTYSSFGLDTWRLLLSGEILTAAGYLAVQLLGGLGAVWLGLRVSGGLTILTAG